MSNIQAEANKVIEKAKSLADDLVNKSCKARSKKPHTVQFSRFIKHYADSIQKTIQIRVEQDLVDLPDPKLASKALRKLELVLSRIAYILATLLDNHDGVPREIYYALDWFLRHCPTGSEEIRYICTPGPELSMSEFNEILASFQVANIYPELDTALKGKRFYFIFLPHEFCSRDASLMWPLIFHEMGHVVDYQFGKTRAIHPSIAVSYAELKSLANNNYTKAIEKLWAQEFTSDYLATLIAGPCFIWQFFRDYSRIGSIMESSRSHPAHKSRIMNIVGLLREQGLTEAARNTEELLKGISATGQEQFSSDFMARADMQEVFRYYKANCKGFTNSDLEGFIRSINQTVDNLVQDILNLRPVIAPPSVLYTIASFCEEIVAKASAQELIADCLSRHCVAEQFKEITVKP